MLAGLVAARGRRRTWRSSGFGELDYAETMRIVVPGVTADVARVPDRAGQLLLRRVRDARADERTDAEHGRVRRLRRRTTTPRSIAGSPLSGEDSELLRRRSGRCCCGDARRAGRHAGDGPRLRLRHRLDGAVPAGPARRRTGHRHRRVGGAARRGATRDHDGAARRSSRSSERLDAEVDVAYCNGVFHHIAPRGAAGGRGATCAGAATRRAVRAVGEQPVEPGHPAGDAPDPVRPRRRHALARRTAGGCCEAAASRSFAPTSRSSSRTPCGRSARSSATPTGCRSARSTWCSPAHRAPIVTDRHIAVSAVSAVSAGVGRVDGRIDFRQIGFAIVAGLTPQPRERRNAERGRQLCGDGEEPGVAIRGADAQDRDRDLVEDRRAEQCSRLVAPGPPRERGADDQHREEEPTPEDV